MMGKKRGRETVRSEESGQREKCKREMERKRQSKEREQQGGGTRERFAEWLLYIIMFSPGLHEAGLLCLNEL